ncbi:hypothetical protein LTR95_012597 [Oleoguttula sp. CCFEE 5521]
MAVATVVFVGAAVGGGVGATSNKRIPAGPGVESATLRTSMASALTSTASFEAATTISSSASSTIHTPPITTTQTQVSRLTLDQTCPSPHNALYSYGGSASPMIFRKFCSRALTALPNSTGVDTTVTSLDLCVVQCATWTVMNKHVIQQSEVPWCNTVCWREGDPRQLNDLPGHCWGWRYENNTDGSFGLTTHARDGNCASAALINQQIIRGTS